MVIFNNFCEKSENKLQYFLLGSLILLDLGIIFLLGSLILLNLGTVIKKRYVNFESVTVFKIINQLPWKRLLSEISSALE